MLLSYGLRLDHMVEKITNLMFLLETRTLASRSTDTNRQIGAIWKMNYVLHVIKYVNFNMSLILDSDFYCLFILFLEKLKWCFQMCDTQALPNRYRVTKRRISAIPGSQQATYHVIKWRCSASSFKFQEHETYIPPIMISMVEQNQKIL